MTKLTLPIVVGKKYVRRDGLTITAQISDESIISGQAFVGTENDARYASNLHVDTTTGRVWKHTETPPDLVADYIEPAKGHPHAAQMAEFAKDASETETPWDRWQVKTPTGWAAFYSTPSWLASNEYRRKPTITPDPHAQIAAEYARDMATTDKAWERWETKGPSFDDWKDCLSHPSWYHDFLYRRKEQA